MRAPACAALVLAGLAFLAAPVAAQPAPDLARAKELYQTAETAMAQGRFEDAARDYGAAYDITKDPVLFYKIGSAHQKAGKCDVALIYYRRYLEEGKPAEPFATTTRERITACGGDPKADASPAPTPAPADPADPAPPAPDPTPGPDTAAPSTTTETPAKAPAPLPPRHRLAWLLVGGSIATFTVGAVLAYSANAAENDVDDLYVGLAGIPPAYDDRTRARFDELIAEGERYQNLSRLSFGIAGALAIGATIRFLTDQGEPEAAAPASSVRVTPTVSPRGGGVSATLRF